MKLSQWCLLAGAWSFPASLWPADERPPDSPAILQLRVVEGDAAVHGAGSRSNRPVTVQVTDETGKPQEAVAVSFRLPDEGPTGVFSNGLKTDVQLSGADGRATAWGIVWGRQPGPVRLRITAVKHQARAGIIVSQYVSENASTPQPSSSSFVRRPSSKGRGKWLAIAAVAAGASGGAAFALLRQSKPGSTAAAAATPPVQIGPPTIVIGKP
jgi:hypothetical protein